MLVSGTAEGITAHVKALFERGQETVKTLRAIITENGHDADIVLPLHSEFPLLTRLGGLMHDTCNTANAAAKLIIEAKNEMGILAFGAAEWAALPPEMRETFDAKCFNHTRQLPITAYDRLSKAALHELLERYAAEVRAMMGPSARVELDGPSFMRSFSKLLDPR